MSRIAVAVAFALALQGAAALAQGVAPGGPIGNSTGIGSGLGGRGGTGPTRPNGSSPPPQPPTYSVPPGGYPLPSPSVPPPSVASPSPYPQPNEPFASTTVRPPATMPLTLAGRPGGNLAFLKGCWRTDVFVYGQQRGTTTWCLDDKGGGRFLYARVDQTNQFCHAQAQASFGRGQLELRRFQPSCNSGDTDVPASLVCREGTDGALCSAEGSENRTVRLYRVR